MLVLNKQQNTTSSIHPKYKNPQQKQKQNIIQKKQRQRQKQQEGFINQKQSQLIDYVYKPISLSFKHINKYNKNYNRNPYARQNMLKMSPMINHQIRQKIISSIIQQQKFKNNKIVFNNFCKFNVTSDEPNPNIQFVSSFQSGNLQLVVKSFDKPNSYELYIRPDTNTKSYFQWFYFKVKIRKALKSPLKNYKNFIYDQINNNQDDQIANSFRSSKIKFTIKNFIKPNMLYRQGLRPYYRSLKESENKLSKNSLDSIHQFKQLQYQNCSDLSSSPLLTQKSFKKDPCQEGFYNLTFFYNFQHNNDQIQFCSQPPYDYNRLQSLIKKIPLSIVEKNSLCKSVMGTSVPYLFFKAKKQLRSVCIVIARQHPGETVGSWMMQGFLNQLEARCDKQKKIENSSHINLSLGCNTSFIGSPKKNIKTRKLLKIHPKDQERKIQKRNQKQFQKNAEKKIHFNDQIAWVIIPMVNVDGVILGNNRTGVMGHDFNRNWSFQQSNQKSKLFPEINSVINFIKGLKKKFTGKVKMFLDLHGHSSQPNVFSYGPPHEQNNDYYYLSRGFPQIIAKKNENFKLNQCSYSITQDKKKTARYLAFANLGIPFSYTIQSSFGILNNKLAVTQDFIQMGRDIAQSTHQFLTTIYGKKQEMDLNLQNSNKSAVILSKLINFQKQKMLQQMTKKYRTKGDQAQGEFDSGSQLSEQDQQRKKFQEKVFNQIEKKQPIQQQRIQIELENSLQRQKRLSKSQSRQKSLSSSIAKGGSSFLLKTQPCYNEQQEQQDLNYANGISSQQRYLYKLSKKRFLNNQNLINNIQSSKQCSLPHIKRKQPLKNLRDFSLFKRNNEQQYKRRQQLRYKRNLQLMKQDPLKMSLNQIKAKLRNGKFGKNIVVINHYGI